MSESHDHGHSHNVTNLSGKRIGAVLSLNLIITIAEIVGGLVSGSLSLLSDAIHNLSDVVSIFVTWIANRVAGRKKDERRTYGYKRAEILAAFVNASALIIIAIFLIFEAAKRFRHPVVIDGMLMLVVASIGLAGNLISVILLESQSHGSMNVKAGYLHLLGDTASSVGVILGAFAIRFFHLNWIDSLLTVLVSVYLIYESWGIVRKSVGILMQSAADLDYVLLSQRVKDLPGVINVHHLHTWMSNEREVYLEAHVEVEDQPISKGGLLIEEIEKLLHDEFGVKHVTLQLESGRCYNQKLFHG